MVGKMNHHEQDKCRKNKGDREHQDYADHR